MLIYIHLLVSLIPKEEEEEEEEKYFYKNIGSSSQKN